jgi:hypothetical protein
MAFTQVNSENGRGPPPGATNCPAMPARPVVTFEAGASFARRSPLGLAAIAGGGSFAACSLSTASLVEVGDRGCGGGPVVARRVLGEAPDSVAQPDRAAKFALGGLGAVTVNAYGVQPCVEISRPGEVVVDAFGVGPDRRHEPHRCRLVGQDPGADRWRGGHRPR